jgi:hypothetical protein
MPAGMKEKLQKLIDRAMISGELPEEWQAFFGELSIAKAAAIVAKLPDSEKDSQPAVVDSSWDWNLIHDWVESIAHYGGGNGLNASVLRGMQHQYPNCLQCGLKWWENRVGEEDKSGNAQKRID